MLQHYIRMPSSTNLSTFIAVRKCASPLYHPLPLLKLSLQPIALQCAYNLAYMRLFSSLLVKFFLPQPSPFLSVLYAVDYPYFFFTLGSHTNLDASTLK